MLANIKIIAFSTKAYPRSIFGFNFICVLVFFQKYAMTSVHKDPKISVNNHYFANRGHSLRGWKFQSSMVKNFLVGARQSYKK